MPYVTLDKLAALIPMEFLTQALDDDNDGDVDAWDAVAAAVAEAIDGPLSVRYSVPFSEPLPGIVSYAALIFAAEMCYTRRDLRGDKNPYTKQAEALRKTITMMSTGEMSLAPALDKVRPSGSLISETARTSSARLTV